MIDDGKFSLNEESIVYYTFLTALGGLSPKEVDEIDYVLVEKLILIAMFEQEKQEREMKKLK